MIKSTGFFLLLLLSIVFLCEAGSYHRRNTDSIFAKREEDCDISCNGDLADCADRCSQSQAAGKFSLRVVCQNGYCYCGFEIINDVP